MKGVNARKSCSLIWQNDFYIFGGDVNRERIQSFLVLLKSFLDSFKVVK